MSLGTSLFLIALFFAIGFFFFKVHQKKKWKLALKIFGGIILLIGVIAISVYAYFSYKNRPQEVNTLGKISLGMTPVQVTLALGDPDFKSFDGLEYGYANAYEAIDYFVTFEKGRVSVICSYNHFNDVFDLGVYDSEDTVLKKLGMPSNVSINKEGLSKIISYEKYKVAFQIAKGSVESVCVADSGKVSFEEEYIQGIE